MTVLHQPGELIDNVQHCIICGLVLADYRTVLIAGGSSVTPKGWDQNETVAIRGNMTYVFDFDVPDAIFCKNLIA